MAPGPLDSLFERGDSFFYALQTFQSGCQTVLPKGDSYRCPSRTAFGVAFVSRLKSGHKLGS